MNANLEMVSDLLARQTEEHILHLIELLDEAKDRSIYNKYIEMIDSTIEGFPDALIQFKILLLREGSRRWQLLRTQMREIVITD